MRERVDIYNFERKIENSIHRIRNSSIDKENINSIIGFYQDGLTRGLSKARLNKYLCNLETIAKLFGKNFVNATKDDIVLLVRKIEENDYSDWTKHDYKLILKIFYKWLRKRVDYPEEVTWIKIRVRNNNILPEEVLNEDEIKNLAEKATNLRDKALILVLYDSGCRIGEILSLRIKNVQFDDFGAVLIVSGKTGDRRVRIIASSPKLNLWIENHPLKDNPNAPLWVSFNKKDRYSNLNYEAAKNVIRAIAERAGIRKRIYPHLFRHSRATHLANFLTEAQMKQHFGWARNSEMASTYVHLSGRDVDNALLKLNNVELDKEKREEKFRISTCPRCRLKNSPDSKFCSFCGLCLDIKTALELDQARLKADKLMTELVKKPDVLDQILKAIDNIRN